MGCTHVHRIHLVTLCVSSNYPLTRLSLEENLQILLVSWNLALTCGMSFQLDECQPANADIVRHLWSPSLVSVSPCLSVPPGGVSARASIRRGVTFTSQSVGAPEVGAYPYLTLLVNPKP